MEHVPYDNVVSGIMYYVVGTWPDIAHVMGVLSSYMLTPSKEYWVDVKRVFKYLHGMIDIVIYYNGNSKEVRIYGFIDSEWAGDIDGRQSTSRYVFILFGGAISWMSRK